MNQAHSWSILPLSFLAAFILTLLPMPDWAIWLRPAWVLMVLIYWLMTSPHRINVAGSWMIGLLLDVLNGTLLGEHALALSFISYFVLKMHKQLRMAPIIQQAFWVLIFSLLYQFIIYCTQGFLGELPKTWLYWSASLTTMLLWPWVYTILQEQSRQLKPT